MKYKNVCLEAWQYLLPEKVVSSKDIEAKLKPVASRFELPTGFFEILTGITERRAWDAKTRPSEIGIQTCQKLMEENHLSPKDIECLIHVSVSRDYLEPATATAIHHGLHLSESSMAFDISNACLGFLNGMVTLANQIELGQIGRGMIVGTEIPTPLVDQMIQKLLTDPTLTLEKASFIFPTLTLGSGSCAMVLAHKDLSQKKHRLLGGIAQNDTTQFDICKAWPDTGIVHTDSTISMKTQSQILISNALKLAAQTWPKFLEKLAWEAKDISHIFSHQVGRAPREEMLKTLHLPENLDFPTYTFLGNQGAIALPISFAMGVKKRNIQPKDKIVLFGFGSGVHCFCLGVEW